LKEAGAESRITEKWMLKNRLNWINLAHNRDKWWALVHTVINPRVQQNAANFFSIWGTVSSSRKSLLNRLIYLFS
jgi:hypothetical protein